MATTSVPKRLYLLLSWGIVLLGVVHMAATAGLRGGSAAGRLWFFGSGVAQVLSGALNLLNNAYGARAVGVRRVCIGNNVFMTGFAFVGGLVTNAGPAQEAMMLGLMGGATLLSFVPLAAIAPSSAGRAP